MIASGEYIPTIWAYPHGCDLLMCCLNLCLVRFVHVIYQFDGVVVQRYADERNVGWHQLHGAWERCRTHFDSLDDLVELEVSDEELIAVSKEAEMEGEVVVGEDALALVAAVNLIVH